MDEKRLTLAPGTILQEHYRIEELIGSGGFAITYRGVNTEKDVTVAIKEFSPIRDDVQTEHEKARFIREAQILREFDYLEGVVSVRDVFEQDECAYLVMDYIEGITLKDYVREYGTFSFEELVRMVTPVMRSLTKIHRRNVTHCDISPDNLIIGMDNRLWLIDFGATQHTNIKTERTVIVKQGYAPIEQYYSDGSTFDGRIGSWTDVYAFAATMYMALTGKKPRTAVERMNSRASSNSEEDVLYSILEGWQADALLKGMAVNKAERYATMDEFIEAISFAPDALEEATRILQDGVLQTRRRRYVFGLLVIAVFSLLLGFGISWFIQGKATEQMAETKNTESESEKTDVDSYQDSDAQEFESELYGAGKETDEESSRQGTAGETDGESSQQGDAGETDGESSQQDTAEETNGESSQQGDAEETDGESSRQGTTEDGRSTKQGNGKAKDVEKKTQVTTEASNDDDDLY